MRAYKHHHPLFPPNLIVSPRDGKKYIVPGWVLVDIGTSLNDIEWVREKIVTKKTEIETFNFPSSSGSEVYITRKYTNPDNSIKYGCNCPGSFRSRDKVKGCKHIQEIRSRGVKN
jgi:hypothetical protein